MLTMVSQKGRVGRLLFVNKKKQKTLLTWGMGDVGANAHGPA
jgi:hypothetical protein